MPHPDQAQPAAPGSEAGEIRRAVDAARLSLLRHLADQGYRFTTPAPSTHRRVQLKRGLVEASTLEDIFGWNLPFGADGELGYLAPLMAAADMLRGAQGRWSSGLRVAGFGELLFLHSAFPPQAKDSVFMGPDSYAFARFIRGRLPHIAGAAVIADIGAGAGIGGIVAKARLPDARLVLADTNPAALALAAVNAAFAGQACTLIQDDGLPESLGPFDVVVANPPYLGGKVRQAYSDGGGALGTQVSLAWARRAVACLKPGGSFLLYTGSPIRRGQDGLRRSLHDVAHGADCTIAYEELDPDVFPSTLLLPAYWGVERIAAVGAVLTRRSAPAVTAS